MSNRYQIVVQGEASETDSDDEVYITSMSAPQPATSGAKVCQCVWECQRESSCSPVFAHFPSLVHYLSCLFSCMVSGAWGSVWDRQWGWGGEVRQSLGTQPAELGHPQKRPATPHSSEGPSWYTVRRGGQAQPYTQASWWGETQCHVQSLADGWVLGTLLWTKDPQIRFESQIKSQCRTFLGICWHQMEY